MLIDFMREVCLVLIIAILVCSTSSENAAPGIVFSDAFAKAHESFHAGNSTYAKLVRLATTDTRSPRDIRRSEKSGERVVVGDRESKYKLGVMLARGRYVKTNMAESEKWLRLAAEQGHTKAQYSLAQLYHLNQGQGTRIARRADAEAALFMKAAAMGGHAKAQYHYALILQYGKGVEETNVAEAAKWYRKAADQGFVPAMYSLSVMYRKGEGRLRRSGQEADRWFTRAVKSGGGTTYAKLRSYAAHKALGYGSKRPHLHR